MFEIILGGIKTPDIPKGTWEKLSYPYTGAIARAAICVVDDDIYVFGGNVGSGNPNELRKYNTVTGVWTTLAGGYGGNYGMFCGHVNGKIYYFAGVVGGSYVRFCRCYDIATNTWSTMPTQYPQQYVTNSKVYSIDGKLIIYGGKPLAASLPYTISYDPVSDAYTFLSTRPTGITDDASFTLDGNRIYSVMGTDSSTTTKKAYTYDIALNQWATNLPDGPLVQRGCEAAVLNGVAYIFGGYPYQNVMFAFDGDERLYSPVVQTGSVLPQGRIEHGFVAVNGSIYMLGGRGNANYSEFWKFTPAE